MNEENSMSLINKKLYQDIKELLHNDRNKVYLFKIGDSVTVLPNKEDFKKLLEEEDENINEQNI